MRYEIPQYQWRDAMTEFANKDKRFTMWGGNTELILENILCQEMIRRSTFNTCFDNSKERSFSYYINFLEKRSSFHYITISLWCHTSILGGDLEILPSSLKRRANKIRIRIWPKNYGINSTIFLTSRISIFIMFEYFWFASKIRIGIIETKHAKYFLVD